MICRFNRHVCTPQGGVEMYRPALEDLGLSGQFGQTRMPGGFRPLYRPACGAGKERDESDFQGRHLRGADHCR